MNISKSQKVYLVWISSMFLAYFAYVQPLNTILDLIRQQGVISISVESITENMDMVLGAVIPTIVLWLLLALVWIVLVALGIVKKDIINKLNVDDVKGERLFYIGAFIEMIWASLYYASFHIHFATVLVFIAMQCFAIKIVLMPHSRREWITIGCLVALGIACEFYTTRGFVLRTILIILASNGIDKKRLMKYYIVINALAFAVIAVLSGIGITGEWIEYDAFRSIEESQNRYMLGFNSPNTTHYVLIRLVLVAMYIWWEDVKLWHIVLVFGANLGLYMLTDSRTGVLVGFVTCVLAVFFKYFKKVRNWKIWTYLAIVMIFVLAIFSLHFLQWNFYQYDTTHECPGYVYWVNELLVGRIHQALKFTQDIELSPLGTRQSGVYCDMGYIKLFLQEGFLFFAFYIVVLIKLLLSQYKNKDYMGYIIVVAISLRMFMESSFAPFVFQNIIWLLLIGYSKRRDIGNEIS